MRRWLVGSLVAIGAWTGWMVAIAPSACTVDAHSAARSFCETTVLGWTWPHGVAVAVFVTLGALLGYLAGMLLSRPSRPPE